MRSFKTLFGAILAINPTYSAAIEVLNISNTESTFPYSALLDYSTAIFNTADSAYSTQAIDIPVIQTDSSGPTATDTEVHAGLMLYATDSAGSIIIKGPIVDLGVWTNTSTEIQIAPSTVDSSAALTSTADSPSQTGEVFSTSVTTYSGLWNVQNSKGDIQPVWTTWEASLIYSQGQPIATRLDLSQLESGYQATPMPSVSNFDPATSSMPPSTTTYDSTTPNTIPSAASTISDASSLPPYKNSTEIISVSQETLTSLQPSSNPQQSSTRIPKTLTITTLLTVNSSVTTTISFTQPDAATDSFLISSATESQGSLSTSSTSESGIVITFTFDTAWVYPSTSSSLESSNTTPVASFSAPLRPVSDSSTILTITTSSPSSTLATSPPSSSESAQSAPFTLSDPSTENCGNRYGHTCGDIMTTSDYAIIDEFLCANGSLAYAVPGSNTAVSQSDITLVDVTCYDLFGSIGPDVSLKYNIKEDYRCLFYENAGCALADGEKVKGGLGPKIASSMEVGPVKSYRCFKVEEWAVGVDWMDVYVDGQGGRNFFS